MFADGRGRRRFIDFSERIFQPFMSRDFLEENRLRDQSIAQLQGTKVRLEAELKMLRSQEESAIAERDDALRRLAEAEQQAQIRALRAEEARQALEKRREDEETIRRLQATLEQERQKLSQLQVLVAARQ